MRNMSGTCISTHTRCTDAATDAPEQERTVHRPESSSCVYGFSLTACIFVVTSSKRLRRRRSVLLDAFRSPDDNGGRKLTVEKCQEPTRGQVSKMVVAAENEQ